MRVWEPASSEQRLGRARQNLELPEDFVIHTARFNRSGRFLAGAGFEYNPTLVSGITKVIVWDIRTGDPSPALELPDRKAKSVVLALDNAGNQLAVAEEYGQAVQVFNARAGVALPISEAKFSRPIRFLRYNAENELEVPIN
jgi:hypothetical protein